MVSNISQLIRRGLIARWITRGAKSYQGLEEEEREEELGWLCRDCEPRVELPPSRAAEPSPDCLAGAVSSRLLGPGGYELPHHTVPFSSRDEGARCVG